MEEVRTIIFMDSSGLKVTDFHVWLHQKADVVSGLEYTRWLADMIVNIPSSVRLKG